MGEQASPTATQIPATPSPAHAKQAPAHPDPYPYYASLARGEGMHRDDANGWWVAASAQAVEEVLRSDACRTRPSHEPVPGALGDGPAAELFGRLVRVNDGPGHARMKRAIVAALARQNSADVDALAAARAVELEGELGGLSTPAAVTRFAFALPVGVLARLLGIAPVHDADVVGWLGDYGTAAAAASTAVPRPTAELIERGERGANGLLGLVHALACEQASRGPLLEALMQEGARAGCEREDVLANAIGLLVQAYVATASLIGLTLLVLAPRPQLQAEVNRDGGRLRDVLAEVLRYDTTTSSTIRWLAADLTVGGCPMRRGETVIVALGAANRDPALNDEPDRFDPDRAERRHLEFGRGAHACPASELAPRLAAAAVTHLLASGAPLEELAETVSYARSAHIRTPLFGS
jgi:cytochrome P450